jgi:hypothetical protein
MLAAVSAAESSGDGDFSGVPDDCMAWTENGDGTTTCTEHADMMGDPGFGDSGIPGFFVFAFVMVLLLGIGTTVWRVSTARRMARDAGMNVDDATAVTLMDDNGLSATYLASNLRHGAPPAADGAPSRTTAQRLAELQQLLAQGLVTQAEHDERRQRILDEL